MAEHSARVAASGVFGQREISKQRRRLLLLPGPEYSTSTAWPISSANKSRVPEDSISKSTLRNPAGRLVFTANPGKMWRVLELAIYASGAVYGSWRRNRTFRT